MTNTQSHITADNDSSNRTFMELKSYKLVHQLAPFIGSNRTFMELKLRRLEAECAKIVVLIVPLWN